MIEAAEVVELVVLVHRALDIDSLSKLDEDARFASHSIFAATKNKQINRSVYHKDSLDVPFFRLSMSWLMTDVH